MLQKNAGAVDRAVATTRKAAEAAVSAVAGEFEGVRVRWALRARLIERSQAGGKKDE